MKIKLIYSYDGSLLSGSQSQPSQNTAEDILKNAMSHAGLFDKLITSSRTDKGVHALNQVSVTKCLDFWNLNRLKELINRHSRPTLNIKNIEVVDENFHPRFDAKARSYRYILNHSKFSPFLANYCYFCDAIDIKSLNLALSKFKGINDYKNFMKTGSDTKSSVREIYLAFAYRYRNLTIIKFKANGFLRSQVRLMVANALKECKKGDKFSLKSPNTRIPAPPNALYLERVFY
ncbi:tRNA pseudouridine(38-40) synthase TruA [Campylobacter corcagiensis]|uniref:tRNA pseudouridine synthase A n=1 Tax=Campylobacter corcagiensis TaxID=1448857 RepID=A0A7M1LEP1_9BACT|nr:tRNA pseudouridine(38-40) synthase TruA [Campylobacter corcagiensis]QKF64801.1 tRNA pseudouridine(38-40) synthase [Campylobacter corcagiensis]QOQ87037.1 tRNA pseudouridine(38-40) synthase TruA [Campylobacter corcagiensis]